MNSNNALSVWNNAYGPLSDLRREMGRLFDDYWATAPESDWHPACDVEEAEDHYLLSLDMPGVSIEQIKLEIFDNQLLISGERRPESKAKQGTSWYSERRYGKFHRSFAIPAGIDSGTIEASYQDGTLRVYIPKAESAKPRQVKITNGTGTGFFGKLIGQPAKKENMAS